MDELLANIRRAITEDNGRAERAAATPDAPVIRGSMREMRVSLEPAANAPTAGRAHETREPRDRVANQIARQEEAKPASPPPPKHNGFADLLTGGGAKPEPVRPAPQPERPGYLQPLGASYFESPVPALKQTIIDEPDAAPGRPPPPWEEEELAPPPAPVPVVEARPRAPAPEAKYLPPFLSRTAEPPPRSFAAPDDTVMSAGTSEAAAQSFQRLAETVMQRAMGDRPVEEVTRELLRGMLRQWLDENLPQLVERIVREEIERVARRGPVR